MFFEVFKEVWHKVDLDLHSQTRYIEMMNMARKSRKYHHRKFDCSPMILGFQLILDMDVKRVDKKNLRTSIAKLAPFFDADFLGSETGQPFKDSIIFNQVERAGQGRTGRSHHSNKYRPASFFKESNLM